MSPTKARDACVEQARRGAAEAVRKAYPDPARLTEAKSPWITHPMVGVRAGKSHLAAIWAAGQAILRARRQRRNRRKAQRQARRANR